MRGGPKYEYLWQDNDTYKTPTKLSAPKYMEELDIWIQNILNVKIIFIIRGIFMKDHVTFWNSKASKLYI